MLNTPGFWYKDSFFNKFISVLLMPFSLLYHLCFFIHKKISPVKNFKNKIISVGGLNVGGSGKTPITIELIKFFKSKGLNTFVIMRGYKSSSKKSILLQQSNTSNKNSKIYGDEALLISKYSDVIIGANKQESISLAENIDPSRIIILDDGHQSYRIKKDIDIIVIDSMQNIGNGKLIPSGPLREPFYNGIKNSDLVVIIKYSEDDVFFKSKYYDFIQKQKPTFICKACVDICNSAVYPFCGIGFPWKFFQSLKSQNNNLLKTKIFPDHYDYNDFDIKTLISEAKSINAKLVTTEKDIVKINQKYYNEISVAKLNIVWEKFDESFFEKIC